QDCEGLGGLAIPARLLELLEQDGVRLAKRIESRGRNRSQTAHRQPRPRERMPPDQRLRQTQLQTELPHFIFEQIFEWLNQLKSQLLGESADIVMGLDCSGRSVE